MTHSPVVLADSCDHLTCNLPLSQDIQCVQAHKQTLLHHKPIISCQLPFCHQPPRSWLTRSPPTIHPPVHVNLWIPRSLLVFSAIQAARPTLI